MDYILKDKSGKIDKKIPDVSNLIKNTDFNTKMTEVEGKMPSIGGLATSSALTAAENKIPDTGVLATISALTTVENKIPDLTNLVKKRGFGTKLKAVNDRVTKNKSKGLLLDNELKKLNAFDSSYFGCKNYFDADDGTQNLLIFQPACKYFKTFKDCFHPTNLLQNGNLKD